jgi:hypothetical protein
MTVHRSSAQANDKIVIVRGALLAGTGLAIWPRLRRRNDKGRQFVRENWLSPSSTLQICSSWLNIVSAMGRIRSNGYSQSL